MSEGRDGDEALADEVRTWVKESWDADLTVREWWARLAESGWGYPTWPTDWFGKGLGPDDAVASLGVSIRARAEAKIGDKAPPFNLKTVDKGGDKALQGRSWNEHRGVDVHDDLTAGN